MEPHKSEKSVYIRDLTKGGVDEPETEGHYHHCHSRPLILRNSDETFSLQIRGKNKRVGSEPRAFTILMCSLMTGDGAYLTLD